MNLFDKKTKTGMARIYVPVVLMLLSALLYPGLSSAKDEDSFSISSLSVADKLLDFLAEDLDNDGLKDILVVHRKGLEPDETRWVSIFWQKIDGGFSTAADQSWEVDTLAVVIDIGDINGDEKREICYLTSKGVMFYMMDGQKFITEPEKIIDSEGLAVFPSKRSLPIIDFVKDWNDDGREEIGIFRFEGLSVFAADSSGMYTRENKLSVELYTGMHARRSSDEQERTSGLSASYRFPSTGLIDYDNDGLRDLVARRSDRVVVYKQGEHGLFSEKPSIDKMFDVRTQREKIENTAFAQTTVHDLNGDGFADAIVTKQSSRGLSNFRCAINIYYGSSGGYPEKPDQVIISEGSASERTIVRDVNGDKRLDMILPSIKISVTSIIRFLLTRSIPINFNIFLLHEDNRYSERPDFSKEVKFKIDFSGETDVQAVSLNGDYDGDSRIDFAFGTGEDELSIYLGVEGEKDRLFSKKPVAKIDVPAFGELYSLDLNNDGYSDMIISYPQSKERKGMIQILMNQKKL